MNSTSAEISEKVLSEVIRTLEILGLTQEIEISEIRDAVNGNVNSLISVLEVIKKKLKAPSKSLATDKKKNVKEDEQYKIINVSF
jgi:3-hydroxy-3-methylglutaryl CoA synthase